MCQISTAEWEVMRVVWASGAIKSSDIIAILSPKYQWSDSTVKTLLGRLVEKNILGTYRQGRAYIYHALIEEKVLQKEALNVVLESICQRHHSHLLLERLEDLPMTLEDIAAFQEVLESKKKAAVAVVPCHCLPGQCYCQKKRGIYG
ncbi:CopY/TcrY family copper transport repressor [Streptococcus castoreus]|uniref:CopY/TcrY family copper transport repressor n=1 Tax=Streptococcus castoreus TaxID=254786 RepID=UPI000413E94B|nr:CopY/TcrY family copper transport repressor [Streptococcus castoreus]